MKRSTVSKRFAKALIEISVEDKATGQYARELRDMVGVFAGNPDLYKLFLNPMYTLVKRNELMDSISSAAHVSKHVGAFLKILVRTRNISLLEDTLAAYLRLEDEMAGRVRATVESPFDLSPEIVEEIKKKLKAAAGKDVLLAVSRNPDIIGGLVIKMDNTVMDFSIRTQLQRMKQKIAEGVA